MLSGAGPEGSTRRSSGAAGPVGGAEPGAGGIMTVAPHWRQKSAPGSEGVPHRGQSTTAGKLFAPFDYSRLVRIRCVALATRDPALYADLAGVLREQRIPSVSLLPGDRIPAHVAIVLTSPAEADSIRHPRVVGVPPDADRTSLVAAVTEAVAAMDPAAELVVGIDPGPRPGYAVLSTSACLIQGSLEAPEQAADLGRHLHRRFPERPLRFRVGSGDPLSRTRIVNALWELHRPIELVDESGTTPRGHRRPRDPVAARRIAGTPGRRVEGPSPLRITDGEITNVQRLSRETSGGHLTISRALASRVLEGQLTLLQAVEEGRRRNVHPPPLPLSPSQPY